MPTIFPSEYPKILEAIDRIDPIRYGKTRNHINGAVTRLSPYISRGVISTKQVLQKVFEKGYSLPAIESFVKELCWRDYFQRVAQVKNPSLPIKQEQLGFLHREIPTAILNTQTSIDGIDQAIQTLYESGYMHNHCRMYTAFLTCNLSKAHWLAPAHWMYYHLLDGDWASNACSWQWVVGANSSKTYWANQENINKFTNTHQANTYLDMSYEELQKCDVPAALTSTTHMQLTTSLPASSMNNWNSNAPAFIYNYYNLDPLWHKDDVGNRVLLLEPTFFESYPISDPCMNFMLELCKNISDIQIFIGSFNDLVQQFPATAYHYKEHPLNKGYQGIEESRDWICDSVTGYFPSFFSYWKKIEKQLYQLQKQPSLF